jgi:hypothetical protein
VKRLEENGSPIAEEALRQIAELYAIEKTVRGSVPEARLTAGHELSAPITETFHPWLTAQLSLIPTPFKLAEDIRYTLAQHWSGLTQFLEDGHPKKGAIWSRSRSEKTQGAENRAIPPSL